MLIVRNDAGENGRGEDARKSGKEAGWVSPVPGLGALGLRQSGSSWSSAGREQAPARRGLKPCVPPRSAAKLCLVHFREASAPERAPRLCQLGGDCGCRLFWGGEKTRLLGSVTTALHFLQMLFVRKLLFYGRNIPGATELGNSQGFVFLTFPLVKG